ncbi:Protein CWC15-like protein [Diplonema papillatum]|nr:Protein CWC15-like protein [Diplonema papillatum]WGM49985.1 AD-002 [Diplonema papillatum]
MTTAHRPTFNSVIATDKGALQSHHLRARDLPGELNLKRRHDLKDKAAEAPRDEKKDDKKSTLQKPVQDPDVNLDSSEEESDDSDDELERMLAKVKREREQEAAKKKKEESERKKQEEDELVTRSNPLVSIEDEDTTEGQAFTTKRRWDDDTPFKNQARDEPQVKRRFINDTVRNDFHRKFMQRYIK